MNNLTGLLAYGQSYWLDNLTRKKITGGEIKKRVTKEGLRGITSNPSIFNKAIESDSYDEQIKSLVREGKSPGQIYEILTVKDVQDACDILKPVYKESGGIDGFVSLEVSPYLARDTKGTIDEVHRLFNEVARPNCYIKIPGTKEGIPAIEQMLYEGIPINITLLFSVKRYIEIVNAYVRALEHRAAEGKPVNNIVSVASFFLSRIDVLTDQLLGPYIVPGSGLRDASVLPSSLLGKAGIASARLAYVNFRKIFTSPAWKRLEKQGAHVQRPLWASTGNKDPLYDDLRYVESLIGPDTVNTLPDETIDALARHGKLRKNSILEGIDEARQLFSRLRKFDIDIEDIAQQLENEGIRKFTEAYNKLLADLAKKRSDILNDRNSVQQIAYGDLKAEVNAACASLDEKRAGRRLFALDPYLWKNDPDQVKAIDNRLGWITLPDSFMSRTVEYITLAKQLKKEGYKFAVLLGMGGSSLSSEVARETFGSAKDYLQLLVLDNTDPAAIRNIERQINPAKTLFIVASKSGTTKESISFFRYFYDQLEKMKEGDPGKHFIAITDKDTPLVKTAGKFGFRKVFINPSDIGGRYSVLSGFGLLPMALMGIDIIKILNNAVQMKNSCDPGVPAAGNPGISLGCLLGIAQRHGRDKITFILSQSIRSFGFWVEQLIAESTGKENKGLVPVNGEDPGSPERYGNDRIFIHICLASDNETTNNKKLAALEANGYPVVRIRLPDKVALGGEYYRWEVATAIAGFIMGINPFDEPNVAESKMNTDHLLTDWAQKRAFRKTSPVLKTGEISIYAEGKTKALIQKNSSVTGLLKAFTSLAQPGDYIGLLPYFLKTDKRTKILQSWRHEMRDNLKVATTLLEGPRYLHSTGQLHKGGPDKGLYVFLTGDENDKLAIPGEIFGFETLHHAQALGDFRSLNDKGRRVILIDLGRDIDWGLKQFIESAVKLTRKR